MLWLTITLYIILTSSKVPHKIAPVHEVTLVRKEELHVFPLCRHLHTINIMSCDTTHPLFVKTCVAWVMHAWEEHILLKYLCCLMTNNEVRILLILRTFLFALIDRGTLIKLIVHSIFCNSRLT